jgi:hypothetical protein
VSLYITIMFTEVIHLPALSAIVQCNISTTNQTSAKGTAVPGIYSELVYMLCDRYECGYVGQILEKRSHSSPSFKS